MINAHINKVPTLEGASLIEHLDGLTFRLQSRFDKIQKLDIEIVKRLPEDRKDTDRDGQYDYEEKIVDALQKIETRRKAYYRQQAEKEAVVVQQKQPQQVPQDPTSNYTKYMNLPKVSVPVLPKDITKFLSWYDQFDSTVHQLSY